MRKLFIMTLAVVLVVGMTGIGYASFEDSNMEEGLKDNPVFEQRGNEGHFTHEKNGPILYSDGGTLAINPTEPGENSSEDSAVEENEYTDETSLVDTKQN